MVDKLSFYIVMIRSVPTLCCFHSLLDSQSRSKYQPEFDPSISQYISGLTLHQVNFFRSHELETQFRSRCIYNVSLAANSSFYFGGCATSGTPRQGPAPAACHLLLASKREMTAFPGASHSSRPRRSAVSSRSHLSLWKCRWSPPTFRLRF